MLLLDMNMPKSCNDCRINTDGNGRCGALNSSCMYYAGHETKPVFCPIKAEIPTGASNGDVLLALYPHEDLLIGSEKFGTYHNEFGGMKVLKEWWSAPYRG